MRHFRQKLHSLTLFGLTLCFGVSKRQTTYLRHYVQKKKNRNQNFYEIQTPSPLTVNIFTHLLCNVSLDQYAVNNKSHNTRKFKD